ncbi:MAG: type II secretion system F family protein [Nocardioidaceae bacterium]|nr:type II secretion system F family protein [Nocardioidaceae bacterium]
MMVGLGLGLSFGCGLWLVVGSLLRSRRPALADRVVPYLQDLPQVARLTAQVRPSAAPVVVGWAIFGPFVGRLAGAVERVLGGGASVRRRLERLGSDSNTHAFRVQQVAWGLIGFALVAALGLLLALRASVAPLATLVACAVAFLAGVLLRDQALTSAVRRREERMLAEFPTVADLMALSVAAGEGPVAALERVAVVSSGEMARDMHVVLGQVRTGTPVHRALDAYAARSGVPVIARFAEGLAVAIERGTPLVDVLHAQAADVREAGRRALIESGARKEVTMMVPIVFLILPVTVVFAFYPGVIGLNLATP